jgi:hypothetical protein
MFRENAATTTGYAITVVRKRALTLPKIVQRRMRRRGEEMVQKQ